MDLIVYNTLTRKKELFEPLTPKKVGLYYCGPTVYWTQHIGNLRGGTCADIVVRTLRTLGYGTTFVRNYTDVGHLSSDADQGEDRMEKAARRDKKNPDEIADTYIAQYERDTALLNFLQPDVTPRATHHIEEMISMVQELVSKGYAYETDYAVYFDVSKAVHYSRLSGQNIEENKAGAGAGEVQDQNKRHPSDFALWFFKAGAHAKALQTWPSPFTSSLVEQGQGFPGWHIECSAMSRKYLGLTLDMHLGGIEHIPVHHTNEIAQSESANNAPFVRYWLHNEHLLVDSKKMAKSEGTGYSLSEVMEKGFDPLALRYFFLSAHYRSHLNFTWDALAHASQAYQKLIDFIQERDTLTPGVPHEGYMYTFLEAVSDDFNVPKAVSVVWNMLKDAALPDSDKLATLYRFDTILGLDLERHAKPLEISASLQELLDRRSKAKEARNWTEADRLRTEIESQGYKIKDTDKGTKILKR